MTRRIALSLLTFCITVIAAMMLTTSAVINQNYDLQTRGALQAECRVLARIIEHNNSVSADEYGASVNPAVLAIHTDPFSVPDEEGGLAIREAVISPEGEGWVVYWNAQRMRMITVALMMRDGRVLSLSTPLHMVSGGGVTGFSIAVFLLVLAMALLFALYLSRSITRPISRMIQATTAFMEGDYSRRVEVKATDEMGRLGLKFNDMADRLQETIKELNSKSVEIENIINAMSNGFFAVDEKMHVIRVNPVARTMFDVNGSDYYGKYVLDVTRNVKLEAHLIAAMKHGELYTAELPVRIDSQNRVLRLYITSLRQGAHSIGAMALIEDITELRRLEQVRVDFVANVTHELKTPLTSIRGFVETLQQGAIDDPEAARRFLSIIAMESERLTRLIDDVLHISALEAGRKRENIERLAFAPYVRQISELLRSTALEKNIELYFEDMSGGAHVTGSEDKIKQLLINLIDNAIKYTLAGGHVWLEVYLENKFVVLKVRDDGIGIDSVHIPRLFERFYRVDKGRSRSMGGTGLGLSIVKHIVLDMNGQIYVESEIGEGTVFTVKLPASEEGEAFMQ